MTKVHYIAKPLGKGTNPDWCVYKVDQEGDEQLVCTVPHWHDSAETTATAIMAALTTMGAGVYEKIGINLSSYGPKKT